MSDIYIQDQSFIRRYTQYSSLYDANFLRELDESKEKTTFARVITLNMDENPIEQVEGRITQGSINIDGNSAVRRTCSLTMVSQDMNVEDYYWGLNTKFKLEIGLKNTVSYKGHYDSYPDIIWFKMGTYLITQFNLQMSPNSFTLNLQGKDKMCLLNGDVGGIINARTDFGTYDYYDVDTGISTNYKLPIKQIIWDGVHAYANEPFRNIIINDVDDLGLELLEYRYDNPLYLIRDNNSDEYRMITLDSDFGILNASDGSTKISEITVYDNLTSSMLGDDERRPTTFKINGSGNQLFCAAKVEYGQTAGYRTCDLVYAGDLIADVGSTFTSILDKIKSMLGEFEYFYDLDGRFVFQRKKSLVNTVWTPMKQSDNETYVEAIATTSNSMYDFEGSVLISSFQNSPNLLNLRNDYTVWGARKGVAGSDIPIHMRYAIDNKPYRYITWDTYEENGETKHYALSTEPSEIIALREELKTQYSKSSSLQYQMEHFERDIVDDIYRSSFYTEMEKRNIENGEYIYKDSSGDGVGKLWWEIWDWAEYFCLAFHEYPGKAHPENEMRYYCRNYGDVGFLTRGFEAICGSSSMENNEYGFTEAHSISGGSSKSNTCEVFFYENPQTHQKRIVFQPHGSCVHTYAEFLDAELYVNCENRNLAGRRDITLKNGSVYHYEFRDLYRSKAYWDHQIEQGLYHYLVYAYDPQIPQNLLDALNISNEIVEVWRDPYENEYRVVDWRELIYRMALDYRKHNHEDGFDQMIAQNNYPLYQNGTGYEQYYTDLEGFWRQLYNYPLLPNEESSSLEYKFTYYDDIPDENLNNEEKLFVDSCYKPIGQRVKQIPKEKIAPGTLNAYIYDSVGNKYYYKDRNETYWRSTTQGFTFETNGWPKSGENISNEDFIEYCKNGELYTRNIPNANQLYVYTTKNSLNGIYPLLETIDYTVTIDYSLNDKNKKAAFYKKIIKTDGEIKYEKITKDTTPMTLDDKASLYVLINEEEYIWLSLQLTMAEEAYEHARAELQSSKDNNQSIMNHYRDVESALNTMRQKIYEFFSGEIIHTGPDWYHANIIEVNQLATQELNSNYSGNRLLIEEDNNNNINVFGNDTNYFIYVEHEQQKLSNIRKNINLRHVYGNPGSTAIKEIEKYTINNQGQKTTSSIKTCITYYVPYTNFNGQDDENSYWNQTVFDAPSSLNFWFDFLEGDNELRQYTTQAVGDRPKAVKEDSVKSIYYRDTPKVIFSTQEKMEVEERKVGYKYFVLPSINAYNNMFTVSSQGIDAKSRIDELLYQHSYCTESIQVTSIPIYYLDVNRRIHVYDEKSKINGDYVVSRLSYSLAYNGTMNITATKAPENSVTEREA